MGFLKELSWLNVFLFRVWAGKDFNCLQTPRKRVRVIGGEMPLPAPASRADFKANQLHGFLESFSRH